MLERFPRETFVVYGYDRNETVGNLVYKPFSTTEFAEQLASARAVIATAGFTLISEALYLGKPYLAFPMQGQYEQHLNAHMLEAQGYGVEGKSVDENTLAGFLYRIPEYRSQLEDYPRAGNGGILKKLDELLADDLQGLVQYRR